MSWYRRKEKNENSSFEYMLSEKDSIKGSISSIYRRTTRELRNGKTSFALFVAENLAENSDHMLSLPLFLARIPILQKSFAYSDSGNRVLPLCDVCGAKWKPHTVNISCATAPEIWLPFRSYPQIHGTSSNVPINSVPFITRAPEHYRPSEL